jgi:hypothetical protein
MAWQLSGFAAGVARVALGPALGLVMLDLALGIEKRAAQHKTGTLARIGRELRERVLSRLGLADDARDALARTRDRAALRVARLTLGSWVPFKQARVVRAVRTSNAPHDPVMRARMLAELAAIRHASDLADLDQPSPWQTTTAGSTADEAEPSVSTVEETAVPETPEPSKPGRVARTSGRGTRSRKRGRKLAADYAADALAVWTPDVEITPAWARQVSGCSAGVSAKVAAAVRAQITATGPTTDDTAATPAGALTETASAEGREAA